MKNGAIGFTINPEPLATALSSSFLPRANRKHTDGSVELLAEGILEETHFDCVFRWGGMRKTWGRRGEARWDVSGDVSAAMRGSRSGLLAVLFRECGNDAGSNNK
jgi:hypothetical protein